MTAETGERLLDWPFERTEAGTVPPLLEKLRQEPPCRVRMPGVASDEDQIAWLVTRYPDVRQALMDPRMSADEKLPGAPMRIFVPQQERPSSFLRMDDPEHTRLRSTIATNFTARRTRAMRDDIQRLVDELLDDLASRPRPADLYEVFCRRLPTLVVARLLGVPDSDTAFFAEQVRLIMSQDDPAAAFGGYVRMTEYLGELADRKTTEPGDDLVSRLANDQLARGEITRDELVGIARLVLVAGHETTTNQLALSILSLLQDDELRATALSGDLLPQFIEESMRYWSLSQDSILRQAHEDMELGGVLIRAGDAVVISIPAANHDPAKFGCPARIDVRRDTSDHLQWGIGPHRCQGAPLAQLEMDIALRSLFTRFPTLALATDDVPALFRRVALFHGLVRLPVTWS